MAKTWLSKAMCVLLACVMAVMCTDSNFGDAARAFAEGASSQQTSAAAQPSAESTQTTTSGDTTTTATEDASASAVQHESSTTVIDGLANSGTYDAQAHSITWTVQVGTESNGVSLAGIQLKQSFDTSQQSFTAAYLGTYDAANPSASTNITNNVRAVASNPQNPDVLDTLVYDFADTAIAPQAVTFVMAASDSVAAAAADAAVDVESTATLVKSDAADDTAATPVADAAVGKVSVKAAEAAVVDAGATSEQSAQVPAISTFALMAQSDGTDQTKQTDQLMLSVDALTYTDINGTVHTVAGTSGGTYDFSSVPLNSIDYLDMLVDFHIRKDGSERTVKAGDYYQFTLDSTYFTLDDMTGTINSQTGVALADYTVKNNKVTVTFTSAVNADEGNSNIFGGSTLKFKLNANGLDNVGADGIPLQLQGDAGGTTYLKTPSATTTVNGITKTGTYNAQKREVTWTITVGSSPEGAGLAGLVVSDTFDGTAQTLKAVYLGDTTGTEITDSVAMAADGNGFTYTFPADSKAVTGQVITVVTGVTDKAISASASGDQTLTNDVAMAKGTTGPNVGDNKTATKDVTVPAPTATKNGTQVDANTIHYDITIDKDGGFAVWNAVLADQLGADADGDTATYKAGTLTVNGTAITVYDSEQQGMTTTYATYIGDKLEVHFADAPLCTATQVSFDATITAADGKTDTNFNFDNTASITGNFPNYEGTGPDTNLHVNVMPEATTDFQVTSVSKEVTNVDKATGKITWKITPSVRTSNFDNWYIEDVISGSWGGSGYTLGTTTGGGSADQTYVADSVKVYDGVTDITEKCCDVATESKSIGGVDTTVLTVKLKDDWVNALKGDINNITVEVTTKAQNYLLDNYVSHTYNNATHLNVTKGLTSFDSHANASTAFSDDYLEKTCTYEVLDNADGTAQGYLHYTIDVNKSGLSCTGLTVTDDLNSLTATLTPKGGGTGTTIPATAWAVDNSKTVVTDITNGQTLAQGGALGWSFSGDNKKVFKANFTDTNHPSTSHVYKIDLYLKLTDTARQQYFADSKYDGATITSSNTASATSTEFNKGTATTATGEGSGTTGTVNNALVSKDGVLDSANGSIDYTLKVNPNAAALTSATIADSLPASVAVDQGSVKLYYATHTTDGAISDELGSEVESGWSVSYAPNATTGGTDMTVSLPDGASSYVLTYTAHVVSNVSSVQNSASLTNKGTQIGSGGATTAVDSSAWGWMDQTAMLKLVKTDALSGTSKTLSGVTFELYDAETGGNLVQTVTTDSNGVAAFYGLEANKDYWYEEAEAPSGYAAASTRTKATTGAVGKAGIVTLTALNPRLTHAGAVTITKAFSKFESLSTTNPQASFELYVCPNGTSNGKRTAISVTGSNGVYAYDATGTAAGTTTTLQSKAADGTISITGLPWGVYALTETVPASGYAAYSGEKYFSVDWDAASNAYSSAADVNYVPTGTASDVGSTGIITDAPTLLSVEKTCASGHDLSGAKLAIYTTDAAGKKTSTYAHNPFTNRDFYTTIGDGATTSYTWDLSGLPVGTYVLSEETAPTDTQLVKIKDVTFKVDAYGRVSLVSAAGATLSGSTTIKVSDEGCSVTVKKLDQYGNGVYNTAEGAKQATMKLQVRGGTEGSYTWTDVTGDNATWTVASAADAKAGHTFTGLTRGTTYRVVEDTVPTGYRTANHTGTQSIEFAIDEYGKTVGVNLNNGEAANGTSGNNYLNVGTDGNSTFTLRDELEVGQVQFTKYDSTTIFDGQGSPTAEKKTLSGISFNLYREAHSGQIDISNDKVVSSAPIVSDVNGIVSTLTAKDASGNAVTNELTGKPLSEGLGEGTYYFKEVSTRSDFCPNTGNTNAFTVTAGAATNYTWSSFIVNELNTATDYRMKNTPLNAAITLTKVDADSSTTKVNGATYELRDATTHAVIDTQTTSANGTAFTGTDSNGNTHSRTNTSDGQLWFVDIPAGSYEVVETVPASGYERDTTTYSVKVAQSETTYNDYTVEATAGGGSVSDAQNSLTVTKTGIEGAGAADLAGATFSLTPVDSAKFADGSTTAITWTTDNTTSSHAITGKLVAGSVYKLSETAAPAGYRTSADVYLKMDANGNLSQCTTADGTFEAVIGNALTVTDVQNSLTVTKAGNEGTAVKYLAGTAFELTPVDAARFADGTTTAITWTTTETSADNTITGKLMAGSVYKLSETVAPEGYKVSSDVYLKMDAAGNLSQCATATGEFSAVANNKLTVIDEVNTFKVTKAGVPGATMKELALTGFALTGVNGAHLASGEDSFIWNTTNESSSYDVRGMLVADGESVYKLQEFKAPAGYQTSADIYLKMDAAGNLSQCATSDGTFTAVTGNVLTVTDAQTVFKLSKTNDDPDPATIAGSTFTLTGVFAGSSDEQTKTLSPTDEGVAGAATLMGQLIASTSDTDESHTYTLTETMAPAGYAISMAPKTLRISAAGTLQEKVDGTWTDILGNYLQVADSRTSFSVAKAGVSGSTDAQLAGTKFELTPVGTAKFGDDSTDTFSWTTLSGGTTNNPYTMTGRLVADGASVYKLSETAAPAGYQTSADVYLKMTTTGVLQQSADGLTGWTDVAKNALTVTDAQNSFSVAKVDTTEAGGKYLAGAEFTLYGTFADGSTDPITWTSTDSAPVDAASGLFTGKLVASTSDTDKSHVYVLTETKAPDGYTITTPTTWLRITESGQLQVRSGEKGSYTWTNVTDNAFKASNDQNVLTLKKTCDQYVDGQLKKDVPLAGAKFTITGIFAGGTTEETRTLLDGTTAQSATEATIKGQLVAGNTYTISETVVPKGYVGVADFQVTLSQDGTVSFVSTAIGVSIAGSTITVMDDATAIGLMKANNAQQLLDGSTFTLTGTFADGTTSKTLSPTATRAATLFHQLIASTSNADEAYTYTLTETVPPEGYQVSMAPKTLRITAGGVLQEKVDGTWKDAPDSLNLLVVPDEQNSFGLVKTDTDGTTRLSGATYTVSGTFAGDTTASTKTLTSAVDSVSQLTGALVAGRDYTITETTPAPGHVLSSLAASYTDAALTDGAMTIRMSAAGVLSYKTTSGADTWAPVGQDNVFEFKDAQTSFTIAKDDNGLEPVKISGATFSIAPATGTTFADGSTDAKSFSPTASAASPITGQLVAGGTYTISETAIPAGFVKTDDFQVKVSADGTTVALVGEEGMVDIEGGTAIVVSDSPTNIFVTKAGAEGATTAQLAGATFELTPVGTATFADGSTKSISTTTTADNRGNIFGYTGSLVVGSVYKLHESIPPAGYKTAADVYLKLTDTGQLQQSDSATGTFNDVEYNDLTVTDSLNSFTFAKADQTGAARTGSTFTLTGMFVGDSAASTLTLLSGDASQTVAGKLVAGNTYTLEETAAPDGCTRMTGKVQITCNSDGTLTLGDGTPSYVTLDESKTTLTVADPFISVVLSKTSRETGEHLDGCSFTVTGQFVDGTTSMTGLDTELTSKMAGNLYASDIPQTGVATQSESSGQLLTQSASGITTQGAPGSVSAQAGKQYVYTVQEVQEPGGYQIEPDPVKFMVDDQGTVYIVADDGSAAKAEGSTLAFSDPAIVTTILKTDANGNALAGATFTLAGTFADGTTSKTFTSGTSATVFDAQLVSKTSYTLTETSAPSGYNVLSSPVTFTVDSLGKVTITNDAGGAAKLTSDGMGIVVSDTAAQVAATSSTGVKTGDSLLPPGVFALLVGAAVLAYALARMSRRKMKAARH